MNENDHKNTYDIVYSSLREYMVPWDAWLSHVAEVEGPILNAEELAPHIKGYYFLPYHWTKPAAGEYLITNYGPAPADHPKERFTPEDLEIIEWLLKNRIQSYLGTGISDEMISLIDNNYDLGVIIHKGSYKVLAFRYSEVKSVTYTFVSNRALGFLWTHKWADKLLHLDEMDEEAAEQIFETFPGHVNEIGETVIDDESVPFIRFQDGYEASYNIEFNNGDILGESLSSRFSFTDEDAEALVKYMNCMLKAHAKCLIVT